MSGKFSFFSPTAKACLFVLLGYILWAVFAMLFLAMPFIDVALFLLYLAFAVAIPGIMITKYLPLNLTPLEALCSSFGFGVFINIALYFVLAPFSLTEYFSHGVIAISIVSLVMLFFARNKASSFVKDEGELKITLIFCAIAALLTFVSFSASNLNPELSGARNYFNDTLMATNLLTSASIEYPFEYFSMAGISFPYHTFFYSLMAIVKNVLDMPSFEVITKLSLMIVSPFLVATIALFTKRFVKSNVVFFAVMILSVVVPCGYTMFYYLYMDVLGYPLGMAFCLLSALFFFKAESLSIRFNKLHLLSLFFLLMALGSKGPLAVTYLFGYGMVLFFDLIKTKDFKAIIPKGLIIAGAFLALYFIIYPPGSGDSMSLSLVYTAVRTPYGYMLSSFLPYGLAMVLSAIIYSISLFPAITIATVITIIFMIRKKQIKKEFVFFISCTLVSMVVINLFKQTGSSELYFLMCLFHFAMALLGFFGEYFLNYAKNPKKSKNILIAVFVVALAFGGYYSYNYLVKGTIDAFLYSRFSSHRIITPEQQAEIPYDDRFMMITPEEYEALTYIRENTEQDIIIADGNYIYSNSYFYGTAFSERRYFIEGYIYLPSDKHGLNHNEYLKRDRIIQFLYKHQDETFAPLLGQNNIDYIVVSQFLNPGFYMTDAFVEKVFENNGLSVYEIKQEYRS